MAKRADLFKGARSTAKNEAPPTPAPLQPVQAEPISTRKFPVAKTREGKRVATVYLEKEALKQLTMIGLDEERSLQELLVEGVNMVFESRGKSRIA